MAAKNWTNCCEIIVSLMVENRHPEPLFDELISTWMGESIHSEYIRYKSSSRGTNAPYELQLRQLFMLWRQDEGQRADYEGFLNLIEGKPFTADLAERIRNKIAGTDEGNKTSEAMRLAGPSGTATTTQASGELHNVSTERKEDIDLRQLLENLNCLNLYETLLKEEFTVHQVWTLDKEDLTALGIRAGTQKRFFHAIRAEDCRVKEEQRTKEEQRRKVNVQEVSGITIASSAHDIQKDVPSTSTPIHDAKQSQPFPTATGPISSMISFFDRKQSSSTHGSTKGSIKGKTGAMPKSFGQISSTQLSPETLAKTGYLRSTGTDEGNKASELSKIAGPSDTAAATQASGNQGDILTFEQDDDLLSELTSWDLQTLYPTFRQEEVTTKLVWDYTLEELKEMNINPTQRKKYLRVIDRMKMRKERTKELSQSLLKEVEKGNLDSIKGIINSTEDENMRLEVINASNDQGQSVLFLACLHNHEKVVAELLKQNCDVDYPTNEKHKVPGSTPLMTSANFANKLPMIKLLLDHNANIRHQRKDKEHATNNASHHGNLQIIKEIVARDPGVIEFKGFDGRTPLLSAAQNGYLNVCNYLLTEKNANANAQDENELTALMLAAAKGHIYVVKLLLNHNANIRTQTKCKSHATQDAAAKGHLDVVKEMVARDPGVIEAKGFFGRTPLLTAAQCGHLNVCNYLLTENNANLTAQDEDEQTALTLAAGKGHINVVKFLLDHNANIRTQTKSKSHATQDAAANGHLDVIKEIIERDPGVIELKGFLGRTPLLTAAQRGHLNVCNYLLIEKNANINTQDEEQSTALTLAAEKNHLNVVELLLKNKAKNLKNKWNKSALDLAVENNNEDMIKLLKT